jgi:hypothetical protein
MDVNYRLISYEKAATMKQEDLIPKKMTVKTADGSLVNMVVYREASKATGNLARHFMPKVWVKYEGVWIGEVVSQHTINGEELRKATAVFETTQTLADLKTKVETTKEAGAVAESMDPMTRAMQAKTKDGLFTNMHRVRRAKLFQHLRKINSDLEAGKYPLTKVQVQALYTDLREGKKQWSVIFSGNEKAQKQILDLSLLAYLKDELPESTVGTVFSMRSLYHFDIKGLAQKDMYYVDERSLYLENGEINERTLEQVLETLAMSVTQGQALRGAKKRTQSNIEKFKRELAKLPASELRYVVAPLYTRKSHQVEQANETLARELHLGHITLKKYMEDSQKLMFQENIIVQAFGTGENFLGVTGDILDRRRIFASMGLKQAFLNAFTDHPVTIKPRFGAASEEKASKVGQRDQTLRSPYQPVGLLADSFQAPGVTYTEHDLYHSVLQSAMPPEVQEIFLGLAGKFQSLSNKDKLAEAFRFALYDMESGIYHAREYNIKTIDPNALFFLNLATVFEFSIMTLASKGEKVSLANFSKGAKEYLRTVVDELNKRENNEFYMQGLQKARNLEVQEMIDKVLLEKTRPSYDPKVQAFVTAMETYEKLPKILQRYGTSDEFLRYLVEKGPTLLKYMTEYAKKKSYLK